MWILGLKGLSDFWSYLKFSLSFLKGNTVLLAHIELTVTI